ncbi:DUF4230 domain-containing protein [Aquimarina rhabdastrellae]
MRNFILGIFITSTVVLGYLYFQKSKHTQETELKVSEMVFDHIENVGKLIVTEGHFSDVITYKDAKKFYWDFFTAEKKALIVVNAKATIAYDLHQIQYRVDQESKTIILTDIPEAEITIAPDITYHDLEQDYLNPFTTTDHNKINTEVIKQLRLKIEKSSLKVNAQNRLISELQKLFILTNALDWKLVYKQTPIYKATDIEQLLTTS